MLAQEAFGQTVVDKLRMPKSGSPGLYAKLETIYTSTVRDARALFRASLDFFDSEKPKTGDLEKFAPLVLRDPEIEYASPQFYAGQPAPVLEVIDTFMQQHYLALAKMRNELESTSLTEEQAKLATAVIDNMDPGHHAIQLFPHSIWSKIEVKNFKSPICQAVYLETKDPAGHDVQILIKREFIVGGFKRADGIKYFNAEYDSLMPRIQARYMGAEKWTTIYTESQRQILEAHAAEAKSERDKAANPIPGIVEQSRRDRTRASGIPGP